MSGFRTVDGFEDVWRPPVRAHRVRRPETVLRPANAESASQARLARLVGRPPEVMVKVSGRTRDPGHLRGHLDYITRKGDLAAEDRDGNLLSGRRDVRDLADDWADAALADRRRRANSPLSHSIILSMPAGTDPLLLRDAARAFARQALADRFDYVFVLHTDTPRPHVHLTVRSLGDRGERLNPKKADLEAWRQLFAEALRERGVSAEATPRRARGVTQKAERTPLRKIRDRHDMGRGQMSLRRQGAVAEAARAAFQGDTSLRAWELQLARRQSQVRALYLAQAKVLAASPDAGDRRLAVAVVAFVADMPAPLSQRLALANALRTANELGRAQSGATKDRPPARERDH